MSPLDQKPVQLTKRALDTPWKAANELRRLAEAPAAWLYFTAHGVAWQSGWRIYGLPLIQRFRGSRITIGEDFEMRNWFGSNPLGVIHRSILATWSAEAAIEIGAGVGMSGTAICAQTHIRIGDRVNLGANCTITDTDFHLLSARKSEAARIPGASSAVVLEGDNFIGMHSIILKGSRIGKGAVIGAGSVVAGDIPPNVVAAGNPARVIREL
jgi:acetyltransferase-like isoleucine patch superfamily enzyme